jgi:HlyD family secretion protein
LCRRAASALACAALIAGCDKPAPAGFHGYVEGEFVHLASPFAGQLQKLHVRRGGQVTEGQPVFVLEQANEQAARMEEEQRLKSAEARLSNLQIGRRAPEVDALRAQLAQAQAARDLSRTQLAQQERLFKSGFISAERMVEVRAAFQRDSARVSEVEAQIRTALLPLGRNAELAGALGEAEAARAALAQATWRLQQKSMAAPAAGLVQDTFFVEGEWVPAGRPVAALLPPANVKARFFVPEAAVGSLAPGGTVAIACDGCGAPIEAKITFISTQAEFTPPIIYSRESRAKLVFLVEARPEPKDAPRLHPGQPVDVKVTTK